MIVPPLVDSPAANKFRSEAGLPTFHKIWFGDPQRMPNEVHPLMQNSAKVLQAGLAKVAALADDPTKTPVVRHETAKKVADSTTAALLENKARQEAVGNRMMAEANDAINETFAFAEGRSPIYERVINWINSHKHELRRIGEASKQDRQIVTVLSHYPPYVFDLPKEAIDKIVIDGYMHHAPQATEKLLQGQAVVSAAAGYDRAVKGVRASFYNPTIAGQAAKRVEA